MILRYAFLRSRGTLTEQFAIGNSTDDTSVAQKTRMMIDVIDHLELQVSGPSVAATKMLDELYLTYTANPDRSTRIRIWIDANDYGELTDGLPKYHYRVNYTVPNSELSVDRRSQLTEDVGKFVLEALDCCG